MRGNRKEAKGTIGLHENVALRDEATSEVNYDRTKTALLFLSLSFLILIRLGLV
jgi:hypothetical protein